MKARRVSKDRRTKEGRVYRTGYNQGHFDASKKNALAALGAALGIAIASGLKADFVLDEMIEWLTKLKNEPEVLQEIAEAFEGARR